MVTILRLLHRVDEVAVAAEALAKVEEAVGVEVKTTEHSDGAQPDKTFQSRIPNSRDTTMTWESCQKKRRKRSGTLSGRNCPTASGSLDLKGEKNLKPSPRPGQETNAR